MGAEPGFEPGATAYETVKLPLLYPAMVADEGFEPPTQGYEPRKLPGCSNLR